MVIQCDYCVNATNIMLHFQLVDKLNTGESINDIQMDYEDVSRNRDYCSNFGGLSVFTK